MMRDTASRGVHGRYVALIRGINVGRAKRIAMADLRALIEALGYRDVRTLLNSGNVVFTAAVRPAGTAAARIERGIAERLGVSARVIVLSASDLADAIAANPLLPVATNHSRLLVAVFQRQGDRGRLEALARQEWTPEAIALGKQVAYLWCADGILASKLATAVGRVLGDATTARNWATMIKLHAACSAKASTSATAPADKSAER